MKIALLLIGVLITINVAAETPEEFWEKTRSRRPSRDTLVVLSYNIENFFHPDNDPDKNDDAFTEDGEYSWDEKKMRSKAARIGRVITMGNGWQRPHVIGLCEIEGPQATQAFLKTSGLDDYGYEGICFPTPDRRGIATALLYDSNNVKILQAKPIDVGDKSINLLTRDVLYAKFVFRRDTFHILVNHWPSKYGGEEQSAPRRAHVARQVRAFCDSLLCASPHAKLMLIGDFNETSTEDAIAVELGARQEGTPLVNLSDDVEEKSYKFQGKWSTIDHVIVSESMCRRGRPEFSVVQLPFLLEQEGNSDNWKPFRTFIGASYRKGYSDHLPVMLRYPIR